MHAAIVLAIVVLALVLFWTEWVPIEVTSILVVFLLAVTGVLSPEEAFSGFANDTVIFIFALLAMTQGLVSTGAIRAIAARLTGVGKLGTRTFLAAMMLLVAAFSAFISNTVTTAALLPVVMSAATRFGLPHRDVLLPMAFASMLGGTILLFGTSTNLVMSEVLDRSGLGGLGVAELAPAAVPIALVGIAVTTLVAPALLRGRAGRASDDTLPPRDYLAEVAVPAGSPHIGRVLADVAQALGVSPVAVLRREGSATANREEPVAPEDRVVLEGPREDIVGAADAAGVELPASQPARAARGAEAGEKLVVVEAAVPPGSRLAGRSVEDSRLGEQLGVELIAIHRRPTVQRLTKLQLLGGLLHAPRIATLPISVGDVLLLRARPGRIRELAATGALLVLSGFEHEKPPRRRRQILAVALFLGALAAGSARFLPMSVAGLGGMLAMVLTGCVDGRRALRVDWRVVLLIGSMLGLGLAMERSGAGALVGSAVAQVAGSFGPRAVLVALALLTIVLSAPMSNQAAALVVFPVAISAAGRLGIDPRALAIAVTLAGSCSFMTPLEPASMLVYGAGGYRFSDFLRVGAPLTVAVLSLIALIVPMVWPLAPP